jgi:uncharacterized OB-fold protein
MGDLTANRVPVAEGLFTWPSDDPRLLGTRCAACGVVTFPSQRSCSRCNSPDMEPIELAARGTLWTWTTQDFRPKSPPYAGTEPDEDYRPFGVGYVELPGQLRVETRLTECDPDKLAIGMEMELVVVPFMTDADGNEVVTFGFQPVASERTG